MKLNIANPAAGTMKVIELDDEKKLRAFYDRRMGAEIEGEVLGDEFAGYIFRISGGNDKQGFPMMQGVLVQTRVRLLLNKDSACYRPRRKGERKRKSVRGCIVGPDLAVLNLVVVKQGPTPLPGLTDEPIPCRLGPKRASKIRKLFNLSKDDDVRKYVVTRTFQNKKGKDVQKRPKIQRLVTPLTLQRKRHRLNLKRAAREKGKRDAAEYEKVYKARQAERRASLRASRRSSKKE